MLTRTSLIGLLLVAAVILMLDITVVIIDMLILSVGLGQPVCRAVA